MGVTKEVIAAGDGQNYPRPGDQVTMHYTGYLENGTKYANKTRRAIVHH
jgi:FKBP-type peptidyl-prolyl cis-trans isomerase